MLHKNEAMLCRVVRRVYFSAAVEIAGNQFTGHNYILEAYIEGPVDATTGMVMSIRKLDELLSAIARRLDHKFLNRDIEGLGQKLPTTENLALYCLNELSLQIKAWPHLKIHKVRLFETEDLWVDCGLEIQPEI